jgi:hypothetical protein
VAVVACSPSSIVLAWFDDLLVFDFVTTDPHFVGLDLPAVFALTRSGQFELKTGEQKPLEFMYAQEVW